MDFLRNRANKILNPIWKSVGVVVFVLLAVYGLQTTVYGTPVAHAAFAPSIITYQGKLLNSSNSAVTTTVSAKFVLFSSLTGGTALYTASGTLPTTSTINITPTNGLFSVNLGDTGTNTLDPSIFQNNQTIYLEVTVAGETLSPRKQITASPFAYNSKYLDGLAPTSTPQTSTYLPLSDSSGNFSFNTVSSTALRDALGWLQNQGNLAKLQLGYNNGGFGGGATPGNITMTSTDFSFFNTAAVNANSVGFVGGAFDGRYIYFAPNSTGQVTRYDTMASFNTTSSYSFFDVATNVTTTAKGFQGAVFDGRYVYFIPNSISGVRSGVVLRYDSSASFSAASSWTAYDTAANVNASSKGFIGAVFDGRYIYLVPFNNGSYFGQVTRFDTTAPFSTASSWSVFDSATVNANSVGYTGAMFDGQYIYFVPNSLPSGDRHGQIGRFDTTKAFTAAGSWSFFNTTAINSNSKGFVFGAFDGRYIYFSPLKTDNSTFSGLVTRYDTAASFSASSSYAFFDATTVHSNSKGFSGATFDGRYLYFIPDRTANGVDSSQVTRYDTSQPFSASGSWSVYDMATGNASAKGYEGAVFDGRYLYLVPYSVGGGGLIARLRAYAGGVDSAQGLTKLARGSDLFIDSSGKVLIGTSTPQSTSYQLFIDAGASANPGLGVNGYIKASGFIAGTTTLDLAELYPISPACADTNSCPEPGDAVCVVANAQPATIEKCSTPYSQTAIGIISTNPGFTLGGFANSATRQVALAGRVPLNVTGPVKVGDRLTTSDTPGVAQVATEPGPTIGIALEDAPATGPTTVLTLVNIGFSLDGQSAFSTSASPHTFLDTLAGWLKQLGMDIQQGVLKITHLVADLVSAKKVETVELQADKICLRDTCVTETELRELLNRNQLNSALAPAPTPVDPPSATSITIIDFASTTESAAPTASSTVPATPESSAATGLTSAEILAEPAVPAEIGANAVAPIDISPSPDALSN